MKTFLLNQMYIVAASIVWIKRSATKPTTWTIALANGTQFDVQNTTDNYELGEMLDYFKIMDV